MASCMVDVAKEIAKCIIIDRLTKWYSYTRNYNDNIKKLEHNYNELSKLRESILSQVKRDEDNMRNTTEVAQGWLDNSKHMTDDDDELSLLRDEEKRKGKDQCCFGRLHCNVYQRYKMSKAAEGKASKIIDLVSRKPEDSMITEPINISELKPVPSKFLTSLESRVKLVEQILEKLQDDRVNVGIFGMGAIGKTTLAKEIADNRARNKFDRTVMVEISEAPDIERIQNQIADQLGFNQLANVHGAELKAKELYTRLTREGSSKILVILDNIWEKLDLEKVGIPIPQQQQRDNSSHQCCCKILVTSRTKDVCKVMGVEEHDIFQVEPLAGREAKLLFRARLGKTVEKEYQEVEKRILNKCQGLPLSIAALADVLKDQEFSMWEHYATELEKPPSIHGATSGVNRLTYSILETSYNLLESDGKRRFLLLASLFPFGASIPIEDMMRYGIGMGFFQHVNSLIEAMEQANKWANELKSSSLLLEDRGSRGHVKIHDVVRASAILLAARDGHMIMIEAIPRWKEIETCQNYTDISLMPGTDHSRLHGLKSNKLQILILDNTQPRFFDYKTFEHMTNLKVLIVKGVNYIGRAAPLIPASEFLLYVQSFWNPKINCSLRTLHLERCYLEDIIGDIIDKLVNLTVLSLSGSTVKRLPAEAMRKLCNLRVLDLRYCEIRATRGIQAGVLVRLCQLEGLYTMGSNIEWADHVYTLPSSRSAAGYGVDVEINTRVDELNQLSYLNVLEMDVQSLEQLPHNDQFVRKLDKFFVRLGDQKIFLPTLKGQIDNYNPEWSRVVFVGGLDIRSVMGNQSAKALLLKTQQLWLRKMEGLEQVLMGRFEFRGVKDLEIEDSSVWKNHEDVEIDECSSSSIKWSEAFPNLESLTMTHMDMLRMIGHQQPHGGVVVMFPKLQRLTLYQMELEANVMPIDAAVLPHNLTYLHVQDCPKLKHIFGVGEAQNQQPHTTTNNNDDAPHALPSLKFLVLRSLPKLESMVEVEMEVANSSSTASNSPATLFNTQLVFGALEVVRLFELDSIVRVWDRKWYHPNNNKQLARNLTRLTINSCGKLESICPLSIAAAALVHLKALLISDCDKIREAIKDEDEKGLSKSESKGEIGGGGVVSNKGQHQPFSFPLFRSLESLYLERCSKMERFISLSPNQFSSNHHPNTTTTTTVEFPSLQTLIIYRCREMQSLISIPFGGEVEPTLHVRVSAPKLTGFQYDGVQQVGDINYFLKTRYEQYNSERSRRSEIQE